MWIERMEIAGFGRLSGEFELERGLTVVHGPNEAGKSTLHDALVRSMFGFDDGERRRRDGESTMLRRAPWADGPFGFVAIAHRAGQELRIEWKFDRERGQELVLRDADTGEDLTAQVAARGGNYSLGEWLLGIGLTEYRQWSCLDQAAGGKVASNRGLVERIRSASETGSDEGGVELAHALIAEARKSEAIGARANTHTPLQGRAYAIATSRKGELEEWIAAAEAVQVDLEAEAQELEHLEAEEVGLERRIAGLEQERLLARRASLQKTAEDARRAAQLAESGARDEVPGVPREQAGEVRSTNARIEELRAERAKAEERQRAAAAELARLVAEAGPIDAEIQGLSAYESVDPSQEARIGGLLGRLSEREEAVAAAAERSDDMRSEGPGSGAASGEPGLPRAGSAGASRWVLPAGIAVASVAGGVLASPVLFAGLLVAVAVHWWLRARQAGSDAAERARTEAEWERARQEDRQRARAEARARLGELQDELATALDRVGVAAGEPRARAESYLAACKRAERLAGLRSERTKLGERIRALQEPAGELQRIDAELEQRRAQFDQAVRALGIDARGAEAITELQRMEQAASEARDRRLAAEQAGRSLETILGGRTVEEVEASLREVESELERQRANRVAFDGVPRSVSEITDDLGAAGSARADIARRLGTARQRVDELEGRLRDLPAWRGELREVEERITGIEFAIDALAIADAELKEAAREAHRRSVPGLNRAIVAELPRLTEGRYTQATVNEQLEITLTAPETNHVVSADRLSQGTQDQIYLVQRLAILELLSESASEPPPLLLDDAFAHFDPARRRAALELLAEKAEERQIVLFVDDPGVAGELEAVGVPFGAIELPGPAERVGA